MQFCPQPSPAPSALYDGSTVVLWSVVTVTCRRGYEMFRGLNLSEHLCSLLDKLQVSQLSAQSQSNRSCKMLSALELEVTPVSAILI